MFVTFKFSHFLTCDHVYFNTYHMIIDVSIKPCYLNLNSLQANLMLVLSCPLPLLLSNKFILEYSACKFVITPSPPRSHFVLSCGGSRIKKIRNRAFNSTHFFFNMWWLRVPAFAGPEYVAYVFAFLGSVII